MQRDIQRAKFYRSLPEAVQIPNNTHVLGEPEARQYIEEILQEEWFQNMFGKPRLTFKESGSAMGIRSYGRNHIEIRIKPWCHKTAILLRLLAHALAPVNVAYHGPEFCAIYLYLVKKCLGDAACAKLIHRFAQQKVNFRPNPHVDSVEGQMVVFRLNETLPR